MRKICRRTADCLRYGDRVALDVHGQGGCGWRERGKRGQRSALSGEL